MHESFVVQGKISWLNEFFELRSCGFIGRNCTKKLSVIQNFAYSISASVVELDELELDDELDSDLEVATIFVLFLNSSRAAVESRFC